MEPQPLPSLISPTTMSQVLLFHFNFAESRHFLFSPNRPPRRNCAASVLRRPLQQLGELLQPLSNLPGLSFLFPMHCSNSSAKLYIHGRWLGSSASFPIPR